MKLLARIRRVFEKPEFAKPKPAFKLPKLAFKPFEILQTERGSYTEFEEALHKYDLIMLIVGKRGSGKTALGMQFLAWYNHSTRRRCYGIGYDATKLPRWIHKAKGIEEISNDSVVLIDEAALLFFSREAMTSTNKMLTKLMSVARHKNLTMLLITQSSAFIELNVLRLADVLLLKEPSLLQARFERKALQDVFEKVMSTFRGLEGDVRPIFYVMSDWFEGILSFELPPFWNEGISRAFKAWKTGV